MDVYHVSTHQSDRIRKTKLLAMEDELPNVASKQIESLPLWLIAIFMISNILLNGLNFIWFGKMIEAIRHREKSPTTKKE